MAGIAREPGGLVPRGTVVRDARPDDHEAILAMHERCSPDSLRRRYLTAPHRGLPRLVRRLLERSVTVVAAAGPVVLGAGHVVHAPGGATAEVALLVEDRWQRRGLGVRLGRALVAGAHAQGAAELRLTTFGDNAAVFRLLRSAGLPFTTTYDGGVAEVRCDLRARPDALAARCGAGGVARSA